MHGVIMSPDTLFDMLNTVIAQRLWKRENCIMESTTQPTGDIVTTIKYIDNDAVVAKTLFDPAGILKQVLYPKLSLH